MLIYAMDKLHGYKLVTVFFLADYTFLGASHSYRKMRIYWRLSRA